jgi:hypothetical protein
MNNKLIKPYTCVTLLEIITTFNNGLVNQLIHYYYAFVLMVTNAMDEPSISTAALILGMYEGAESHAMQASIWSIIEVIRRDTIQLVLSVQCG